MSDYKRRFDIFICGGSQHVAMLQPLLAKLQPFGTIHLASSFLTDDDLRQLHGRFDVLHTPRHSPDGYSNFELFSIRDINRLATAPYFVKLDADIELDDDWIAYVEECLAASPDAVLFGPRQGNREVTMELSGGMVRELLGQEIRVAGAPKVIGGFYVGKTNFFRDNARFMELAHELLWCFKDGVRCRPSPYPQHWPARLRRKSLRIIGDAEPFRAPGNEDTLRSLVVHALGAGDRLHVFDSMGRIRIYRASERHAQAR